MANEWTTPIADMDVTDVPEVQVLPAGVTLEFEIEPAATFNEEWKAINFKLAPVELPSEMNPSAPVARADWSVFLPNREKDDDEKLAGKQRRLKKLKNAFGIPLEADLDPAQFYGKRVKCVTKERKQSPEETARFGRRVEVDDPIEVLG